MPLKLSPRLVAFFFLLFPHLCYLLCPNFLCWLTMLTFQL